ncbi:hypothetical protein PS15p_206501 [Mucor circinelloides]
MCCHNIRLLPNIGIRCAYAIGCQHTRSYSSLSFQFPSSSLSYLAQEPSQLAFPHDRMNANGLSQFIIDWFDAFLGTHEEVELAKSSRLSHKGSIKKRSSNYDEDEDEGKDKDEQDKDEGE